MELDILTLLMEYNGYNNQILEWKEKIISKKINRLSKTQFDYVLKYKDIEPKNAQKFVKIYPEYGERLKSDYLLDYQPETVWCEKLLCESDRQYHFYGRINKNEENKCFWIPKAAIIKGEKKIEEINYEKYNVRPLLPHQKIGVETLLKNNRYILADSMGVMKTTTALVAALESEAKRVLIVCPATLKINWKREIEIYSNKSVYIVNQNKWKDGFDYYIINYDIIKNFHSLDADKKNKHILLNAKFDLAVVDEAHYISNEDANRTKLLTDFLYKIPKVWLLTGTPMTSRPINFFNLLSIVESPLSLNWEKYVTRYCSGYRYRIGNRRVWNTSGASHLNELREKVKPIMLRRLKEDILDLPEKLVSPIYLELTNKHYDIEMDNFIRITNEKRNDESLTVAINRLMTIRMLIAIEKVPYTCELIEKCLLEEKKVVVLTNFTKIVDMLKEKYGKSCVILDGRMSIKNKQESVDNFQTNDSVKIFVGNIKAAGVGITLTAGEVVIMNDLSFVPSDHAQGEDRCVFKGQLILTKNGYVKIEDVKIGDLVYTHLGNFKKVTHIKTHLERKKKRVDITAYGYGETLKLTEDHLVYVYNRQNDTFQWIKSIEIDIHNHCLTFRSKTLPTERKKYLDVKNYVNNVFRNNFGVNTLNARLVKLPEKVELTNELLYAFGFYVAEGWSHDNDMSDLAKSSTVSVCQKIDNKKMYDAAVYIIEIFKKSFNIKTHNENLDELNVKSTTLYSKNLAKIFIEWFGHKSENKKFPDWVFELNNEQITSLLNGYEHGYHRKNVKSVVTVSPLLASQLIILNAALGRSPSLVVKPSTEKTQTAYIIDYSTDCGSKFNRIFTKNDHIIYPINSLLIKRSPKKEERVYDLSVEDDNSFVVGVYNVHNCYRYGQTKSVSIYYPIFENTIEMIIYNMVQKKKNNIDQVLGDNEFSQSFATSLIEQLL